MAAGDPGVDNRRVRAAVLGSPVGHSLSPVLHNAAYAELGLTWWRYEAIECDEASLPAFLDRCGPDWAGVSLTMPLKRAVLPLLDRLDPLVTDVGAANTVLLVAARRLGYNTDVPGMVRAILAHDSAVLAEGDTVLPRGIPPGPDGPAPPASRQPAPWAGSALVIGGGATACAALAALRDLGERAVTVLVRDPGRAGELRAAADRLGVSAEIRPLGRDLAAGRDALAGHRLIFSTIPAGAADFIADVIGELAPSPELVFDVGYHPWPTPLARAAARAGAVVVGGFDLLLHQAALQVELMTGRPAPVDDMREAGLSELRRRRGLSP